MSRFSIDFFELSFLADVCIPPVPIARHSFWYKLIDQHYDVMTPDERLRLREFVSRQDRYKRGIENQNEDVLLFEARYDPDNQYLVYTNFNDQIVHCFLFNDEYRTSTRTSINPKFIIKVEKL